MREILFRGKREENGEWVYGVPIRRKNGKQFIYAGYSNAGGFIEVDPETICQYTGLTDRNGRKIFEGDIVREVIWGSSGIVRFGEHGQEYGYYIEWTSEYAEHYRQDLLYWVRETGLEVSGNIFDDPFLLEGGAQ
ncbi:MAG: YopX family protein [Lachnospiraceae bacterium]|nr:YopX family protein [Lachnospiraceae bacterium]